MRGRGSQGEGGIETPLPLSGFLVTFAPWQKSLAAAAAKHPPEIKYTAPKDTNGPGAQGRGETPHPQIFLPCHILDAILRLCYTCPKPVDFGGGFC